MSVDLASVVTVPKISLTVGFDRFQGKKTAVLDSVLVVPNSLSLD